MPEVPALHDSDGGDEHVAAYAASMPAAYRTAFCPPAIAAHAAIVCTRAPSQTLVARWADEHDGTVAICLVADDRPGLLSQISAVLVAHDIDVVVAHAYCRRRSDGALEAVDFLWLRRVPGPSGVAPPLLASDLRAIAQMVDALLSGRTRLDENGRPPARRGASRALSTATRIRFAFDEATAATVLTVEAVDKPGLLLSVTRTIFVAGMQIVGLRAQSERGRAIDEFHLVELDGTRVRHERLLELQSAILAAVDAAEA